ncbi:MAG TPA: VWA domain-containing protein [Vicinamibacterales bacterium]|nr:VWA domain-containing protein [Vicinamibacterales bacterium]
MSLTLTAPGALWLIAAVLVVWAGRRYARTNFNPRQRLLQTMLRSLLVVVLALAIARPVISLASSQESIVFAVDVSASVSSRAIADAAKRIDDLIAAVHPSHTRIVAFGAEAATLDTTAALRQLGEREVRPDRPDVIDRTRTDLERALDAARAELRPGYVPRIVLFSDGRATAGDVRAATARLAAAGVPVSVDPMAPRVLGDTWIDAIAVPPRSVPGALMSAAVVVGSQRAAQALVELRDGTRVLGSRVVTLAAGDTSVPFDVSFDEPGAHALEATVAAPDDPLAVNNQLRREVVVGPHARVLYIESAPDSARYLATALAQSGFDVTADGPSAIPSTVEALDPWDVVILSDIPRAAISDAAMSALSVWVEQRGGGLLVAGGDSVFGEGGAGGPGYRKTELERLTPVTFERKDEPEVALIIVLDKSWSMAGQQMELCKAAAQAAVDVMADEQSVGVVTFNDELNWDVTLRNVGKNRAMIKKAIAAIEPSGHTLIYPAIEQAYLALKNARARAKHVVLLSDGRSYPDDYEGLVKKMVAEKMTVSSIAVGPAADRELLGNIAQWGKGRNYIVEDAKEVPQIFVKEARSATNPSFDEKPLRPVLKTRAFLEGVDFTQAPSLHGRTATVLKDGALELVETPDHDPLLAFWPIGLGRTAVFASDVKDRWASDWIKWRGYGPFFASVVRAVARSRAAAMTLDVVPGPIHDGTRSVVVTVEARDAAGAYRDLLKPMIRVQSARGSSDLAAHQTAPGRYDAAVVVDAAEPVTIALAGADASASRVVLPDPNEEYRWRPADEPGLKAIADATGGAWKPTPEALRNTTARQAARRAIWPALVVLALGLWLLDIWLRRVRVFERSVSDVSRAARLSA